MAQVGVVDASLTAANTFSDVLSISGEFSFSLSGTWVATVHVQKRHDGGSWLDVDSFSSNSEEIGEESEREVDYRFGIKAGNFTSGTVVGRIARGGIKSI